MRQKTDFSYQYQGISSQILKIFEFSNWANNTKVVVVAHNFEGAKLILLENNYSLSDFSEPEIFNLKSGLFFEL